MVKSTLKITDENYAEGTFILWINEHGHTINITDIRAITRNLFEGNVSREMLCLICAQKIYAEAKRLGVPFTELSFDQCKSAIETLTEI